jgi:ubiquitin carboxyl-terminal hydrolase 1
MAAVEKEGLRDRGIAGVLDLERQKSTDGQDNGKDKEAKKAGNKNVFDGLTANRRSCVMCGYTEAVMHFGFDNWQLALPRLAVSTQFSLHESYLPMTDPLTFRRHVG